jgi:hypothetical protein
MSRETNRAKIKLKLTIFVTYQKIKMLACQKLEVNDKLIALGWKSNCCYFRKKILGSVLPILEINKRFLA